MKNTLQLQIVSIIKKANYHYKIKDFSQSVTLYERALQVYHDNLLYNNFISTHFEAVINSLKGQAHIARKQYSFAESLFNQSLRLNPHDSLTLTRRANLYLQTNRLADSVQDAEKAYICDPQGKSVQSLISSLKIAIQQIEDQNQKQRLKQNICSISCDQGKNQQNQLDQESSISFYNLKKIDRSSFSSQNNKSGKLSAYQDCFGTSNSKLKHRYTQNSSSNIENDEQLLPVSIIQKNKSKKPTGAQRSFLKCLSINLCQQNQDKSSNNTQSKINNSVKSIDHQLQRRTSVKFLQNSNNVGSQNLSQMPSIQNKKQKTQRKSCLRSSKICATQQPNANGHRRTSSFMQLKNVDGVYLTSSISKIYEDRENSCLKQQENIKNSQKQMTQSDDDDESKQHNIYGDKYGTGKILKCLQNLNNWSGKHIDKLGKKGSILKKNSIIASQKQTKTFVGQVQHKKSVCFLDEN